MSERLNSLSEAGVSIWLDDLSRERIETGNLADLVKNSSVVGVTTNPTIFAAAMSDGERYDDQLRAEAAAGAGAGIYGMVRARRAAEAITPDGLRDRRQAYGLGARLLRDEIAAGAAEKEIELRDRLGLPPNGRSPESTRGALTTSTESRGST